MVIRMKVHIYIHSTTFAEHCSVPHNVQEYKPHEGRDFGLLYTLLYPQCLKHCLAQRRYPVTCWMGGTGSDRNLKHIFFSQRLTHF